MVKPLAFKGDKKPVKKRKRAVAEEAEESKDGAGEPAASKSVSSSVPDDDSWVSAEALTDISGPILIVLPTETPSALACDANGKVFPIPVENMIESNPSTAEPHDIRQVWIANRVAGSEKFSFKSHHGRYLGCDKFGVLSAQREAISPEENFLCIPVAGDLGAFAIQTERDGFFTVDPETKSADKTVRGDAEKVDFSSSFHIRMQARFKPKLKVAKEEKAKEKISRKELEEMVGQRLEDEDVKRLKRARREGNFHEVLLDVKVKGKHDKFA